MDVIALVGRILFALIFLGSGTMGHIGQRKGMAQYASSQGVPAAEPLGRRVRRADLGRRADGRLRGMG